MALEKIIKSVKNFGRAALLAGSMLVSGCMGAAGYIPLNDSRSHGVYPEIGIRCGVEGLGGLDVNAGETLHYIPIHPDDGGTSRGGVHTEFEYPGCFFVSAGLECSIGTRETRFSGGIDFRAGGSYNEAQEIQPLPPPYESYGWTEEEMSSPYMPFVRFNQKVSREVSIGFEAGFPYAEVEASTGHYRNNQYETIMRGTWKGFGVRYCLNIDLLETMSQRRGKRMIGFSIIYEKYEPEFGSADGGKIESMGLLVQYPLKF